MSDKRAQTFHTDDASPTQIWVVMRHQYGIFALVIRHFTGKPVVVSPNVGCFSRLSRTVESTDPVTVCLLKRPCTRGFGFERHLSACSAGDQIDNPNKKSEIQKVSTEVTFMSAWPS